MSCLPTRYAINIGGGRGKEEESICLLHRMGQDSAVPVSLLSTIFLHDLCVQVNKHKDDERKNKEEPILMGVMVLMSVCVEEGRARRESAFPYCVLRFSGCIKQTTAHMEQKM